jgi:phosphomannomutase
MPQISHFFGIIIRMFYDEHNPPHFHAQYAEYNCCIGIQTLAVMEGVFPPRALGLVIEWATIHKDELLKNWERMKQDMPLQTIPPLL